MNKVYVLIGGNIGDRTLNLQTAIGELSKIGIITIRSSVFETAAWGITDQKPFLNQVVLLNTEFDSGTLIKDILKIEETMGRKRTRKFGPRKIDMDILFFNNEVIREEHLTVPHPQIQNRRFTLIPLNEIAPQFVHPVLNKTISQLLLECPDQLEVTKYEDMN